MARKLFENNFQILKFVSTQNKFWTQKNNWIQHFLRPNSSLVENFIGKLECGSAQPSLLLNIMGLTGDTKFLTCSRYRRLKFGKQHKTNQQFLERKKIYSNQSKVILDMQKCTTLYTHPGVYGTKHKYKKLYFFVLFNES